MILLHESDIKLKWTPIDSESDIDDTFFETGNYYFKLRIKNKEGKQLGVSAYFVNAMLCTERYSGYNNLRLFTTCSVYYGDLREILNQLNADLLAFCPIPKPGEES